MHYYPRMLTAVGGDQSVIEGGMMREFDCQRVFQSHTEIFDLFSHCVFYVFGVLYNN